MNVYIKIGLKGLDYSDEHIMIHISKQITASKCMKIGRLGKFKICVFHCLPILYYKNNVPFSILCKIH